MPGDGVEFGSEDSILVHRDLLHVRGEEKLTKSKTRTAKFETEHY